MSQKEASSCTEGSSSGKCVATAGCSSTKADGIAEVLVSNLNPKNSTPKQLQGSRNFHKHLKNVPSHLVNVTKNGKITLGPTGIEAVKAAYEIYKKDPTGESNRLWFASHNFMVVFRKQD